MNNEKELIAIIITLTIIVSIMIFITALFACFQGRAQRNFEKIDEENRKMKKELCLGTLTFENKEYIKIFFDEIDDYVWYLENKTTYSIKDFSKDINNLKKRYLGLKYEKKK